MFAELDRRRALRWIGAGLLSAPALKLIACDTSQPEARDADDTRAPGAPEPSEDAQDDEVTALDAAGPDTANADTAPEETTSVSGWATGGTAAMTARASYPNPFAGAGGTSCELQCQTTIGPCHTTSPLRSDISDGWDGLPVRLSLRLVDADCRPLAGSIVEVWHTNPAGVYSGRINPMCNSAEADRAAQYFRGYQVSDADGRVDFDTCLPGWYRGRVVHIHYRVMSGAYDAADSAAAVVVSQLFFASDLVASIFDREPIYADFGQPDTTLATDNVIGGERDLDRYLLDTTRASDGAMIASKTLVVRTGAGANCTL